MKVYTHFEIYCADKFSGNPANVLYGREGTHDCQWLEPRESDGQPIATCHSTGALEYVLRKLDGELLITCDIRVCHETPYRLDVAKKVDAFSFQRAAGERPGHTMDSVIDAIANWQGQVARETYEEECAAKGADVAEYAWIALQVAREAYEATWARHGYDIAG